MLRFGITRLASLAVCHKKRKLNTYLVHSFIAHDERSESCAYQTLTHSPSAEGSCYLPRRLRYHICTLLRSQTLTLRPVHAAEYLDANEYSVIFGSLPNIRQQSNNQQQPNIRQQPNIWNIWYQPNTRL